MADLQNEKLAEFSLAGLAAGVAAGRFSPVDIMEACLARIAGLEPRLHAFVEV
jgi:Asp-tRNA(Asn)/Glu-tRNA(Gln) amidotransferase A subunit family amidase